MQDISSPQSNSLILIDQRIHTYQAIHCHIQTACLDNEKADIGHMFDHAVPDDINPQQATQITRLNNGRWAAVLGNGYDSHNQRPVLLIQYLDGDLTLLRIVATGQYQSDINHGAAHNGLSTPRLVDINRDGRPDVAYAGDIQGNLWKFDLTSPNPDDWKVAFGGRPLFTALGKTSTSRSPVPTDTLRQPITTAPIVRFSRQRDINSDSPDPDTSVQGLMVAFGTGLRNGIAGLAGNAGHSDIQSLYGVLDYTHYSSIAENNTDNATSYLQVHPGRNCPSPPTTPCTPVPNPRPLGAGHLAARLIQQQIGTPHAGTGKSAGRTFWPVNLAAINHTNREPTINQQTHNGWYLDLPPTGERVHHAPRFYDSSNLLAVHTQIPAQTPQEPAQYFLTLLNIMDGSSPSTQILDMNGDGLYDSATDQKVSRVTLHQDGIHSMQSAPLSNAQIHLEPTLPLARPAEIALRPSWRQFK